METYNEFKWGSLFSMLIFLMGCSSQLSFLKSSSDDSSDTVESTDTTSATAQCELSQLTVPIKIIFVVDASSSNVSADEASDPDKSFRYNSMLDFYSKYKSKSNFSWSLVTFNGQGALPYMYSSAGIPIFSDATAMSTALNKFLTSDDDRGTPYLEGLNAAKLAIQNDSDLSSTEENASLYYIIFLSDGYPSDAVYSNGTVNLSELNSKITEILSLATNRIFLNTIYYSAGGSSETAETTLQTMAATGNGVYTNVDTTSTDAIDIQDLIEVSCD